MIDDLEAVVARQLERLAPDPPDAIDLVARVGTARRRRQRRALSLAAVVIVVLAVAAGMFLARTDTETEVNVLTNGHSASTRERPTGGLSRREVQEIVDRDVPRYFIGAWRRGTPDLGHRSVAGIGLFAVDNGRLIRTLTTVPAEQGWNVRGVDLARDGTVWWAVARGPILRGSVAGGDPQPGSCSSTIYRLSAGASRAEVVVQGTRDELVGHPAPSPDGERMAYTSGACTWSGSASHVVVRNLTDTQSVVIGRGAPPCAGLNAPSWSRDSARLVVTVSLPPERVQTTPGVCAAGPPSVLAITRSDRATEFPGGDVVRAHPARCALTGGVFTTGENVAVVRTCGDVLDSPKEIQTLDAAGRVTSTRDATDPTQPGSIAFSPTPRGDHALVTTELDRGRYGTRIVQDLHARHLIKLLELHADLASDTPFLYGNAVW